MSTLGKIANAEGPFWRDLKRIRKAEGLYNLAQKHSRDHQSRGSGPCQIGAAERMTTQVARARGVGTGVPRSVGAEQLHLRDVLIASRSDQRHLCHRVARHA